MSTSVSSSDSKPRVAESRKPDEAPATNKAANAPAKLDKPSGGGSAEPTQHTSDWKAKAAQTLGSLDAAPTSAPPGWPKGPLAPSQEVNKDAETMQRRLVELGHLGASKVEGNWGRYGDITKEAVSDFQLANGLTPTGIADETTLARMGAPTALTEGQAVDALETRPEQVIGQTIGTAGPSPKPVLDPNAPQQMTIQSNQNVNCRESPVSGTPKDQLSPGTTVTVVQPQPAGGQQGWLYVEGQGQKGPVSGWVSTQLMQPKANNDPRVDTRLQDMGYLPPGGATDAEAVKNFQAMNRLPITGEMDQRTLDAMWSPDARQSYHVVQFQDSTYNPTKLADSGNAGGDNNCGPTSVGMALASLGLANLNNADPQDLVAKMRTDSGTTAGNTTGPGVLEAAAQKNGAETYRVDDLNEVKLAVMRGDPVVLYGVPNKNGTYYNAPASEGSIHDGSGHWVTVVGYDPQTDKFIVNDPLCRDGTLQLTQDQLTNYADFSVDSVAVHRPN